MDGILIIDKPAGITSHDVVAKVRRILKTKRVGHTGTLDPFATGVMVILVGQATRLAQFLDKDEKEYEAIVRFGFETDTGDRTGSPKPNVQSPRSPSIAEIDAALPEFRGEIEQTPPMYSAKKIDGKKLYEHARKGEVIDRKQITVTISELELIVHHKAALAEDTVGLRVRCSAGTYIRTLAEDIGRRLGLGAHLAELRRTAAGKFTIGESTTLDKLADLDAPDKALVPMNEAVTHLRSFAIPDDRVAKTKNGMSTRVFDSGLADRENVRMIDPAGELVAIGFFDSDENIIQPKVVLV